MKGWLEPSLWGKFWPMGVVGYLYFGQWRWLSHPQTGRSGGQTHPQAKRGGQATLRLL